MKQVKNIIELNKLIDLREEVEKTLIRIKELGSNIVIEKPEPWITRPQLSNSYKPLQFKESDKVILDFDKFLGTSLSKPTCFESFYKVELNYEVPPAYLTVHQFLNASELPAVKFFTETGCFKTWEPKSLEKTKAAYYNSPSPDINYPRFESKPAFESLRIRFIYTSNSLYESSLFLFQKSDQATNYSYSQIQAYSSYLSSTLSKLNRNIRWLIRLCNPITCFDRRFSFRKIINFLFKNLDDAHSSVNNALPFLSNYFKQNNNETKTYSNAY